MHIWCIYCILFYLIPSMKTDVAFLSLQEHPGGEMLNMTSRFWDLKLCLRTDLFRYDARFVSPIMLGMLAKDQHRETNINLHNTVFEFLAVGFWLMFFSFIVLSMGENFWLLSWLNWFDCLPSCRLPPRPPSSPSPDFRLRGMLFSSISSCFTNWRSRVDVRISVKKKVGC